MLRGGKHASNYRRKRGHRHSTDDLLTAWYALEHAPNTLRAIDLGTGIGGVALLVESQLPAGASVVAIDPSTGKATEIKRIFLRGIA